MKHVLFIYAFEFEEITPEIVIDIQKTIFYMQGQHIYMFLFYTHCSSIQYLDSSFFRELDVLMNLIKSECDTR